MQLTDHQEDRLEQLEEKHRLYPLSRKEANELQYLLDKQYNQEHFANKKNKESLDVGFNK